MSFSTNTMSQADPTAVFDLRDDAARVAYFKQMGAQNCDPPLQHSPFLRNKKTGAILPWEPILAEQTEILECCDAYGNTDPAAWQPLVIEEEELDPQEAQIIAMQHLAQVNQSKRFINNEMRNMGVHQQSMPVEQPVPEGMPYGAIPYDDVQALVKQLES